MKVHRLILIFVAWVSGDERDIGCPYYPLVDSSIRISVEERIYEVLKIHVCASSYMFEE